MAAAIVALGLSACGSDFASDDSATADTAAAQVGSDFAIGGGETEAPAEVAGDVAAPATAGAQPPERRSTSGGT